MASVERLDWDEDQIAHVKSMYKYFRSKRDKHLKKFRWHLNQWQIHDTNMHITPAAQARIAAVQAQKQWQFHDANMHICEHILKGNIIDVSQPSKEKRSKKGGFIIEFLPEEGDWWDDHIYIRDG